MDELPKEYEMKNILLSESLPNNLTVPNSSKTYFETVKNQKGLTYFNPFNFFLLLFILFIYKLNLLNQ